MRMLFCIYLLFPILAWPAAREFTLEQARTLALSQNPELVGQAKEFESSQYAAKRAFSPFLPKLGIEYGQQSYRNPDISLTGEYKNIFAEYSLFNGGRDYYLLEFKNLQKDASEIRLDQKKQTVEWDAERAFSKLLFVTESIQFYKDAIQRNKEQQKAAAARRRAGLVSEADTLEFEVLGSLLDSEFTSLKAELVDAQADFKKVLNLKDDVEPVAKGRLEHFHVKTDLQTLLGSLGKTGKSILMAQKETEASEALQKSVRGDFLPNVFVKTTYGSRDIRDTPNDKETAIWLVARWEIFSGLDTYWGYRQANAEFEKNQFALESEQLNTKTNLERTFALLKALEQRVDLESMNRKRAKKYFTVVASEYKRGVKNSPDLRSASEKLLESQIRDLKYRYECIAQKIALQKIVGAPIPVVPGTSEGHAE